MSAAVRRGAATSVEGEKNLGQCEEASPPSDGVILDKCSFSADQSAAVIYH
jgi:hypothetical protein